MRRIALLFVLLGSLVTTTGRADEAPSAFAFDLKHAPNEFLGVKYLNAALNRLSTGKQLMAVQVANVQNGQVALDLKTLFPDEQRRAIATLEPAPGQPIPIGVFLEALLGPKAPELDGIRTKADLQRIVGFDEAKDFAKETVLGKNGGREAMAKWSEVRMAFRRIHPEKTGKDARPAYEQWILTAPNGTVREYFFGLDGQRLVTMPEGVDEGPRKAIERRIAELKRSRTGFGATRPWYDIQDLARRADMASNAASDDLLRKFVVEDKKRRAMATPTPTATVGTPGAPGTAPAPTAPLPAESALTSAPAPTSATPPEAAPTSATPPDAAPRGTPSGRAPSPPP